MGQREFHEALEGRFASLGILQLDKKLSVNANMQLPDAFGTHLVKFLKYIQLSGLQ